MPLRARQGDMYLDDIQTWGHYFRVIEPFMEDLTDFPNGDAKRKEFVRYWYKNWCREQRVLKRAVMKTTYEPVDE